MSTRRSDRWAKRNEAIDERLVGQMRQQLSRLQDRHRELESRYFDDDGLLREPVAPHVSRLMRDRHVASLRVLLQRNMNSIEQEIQDTIRRLGTALTEQDEEIRSTTTTSTSGSSYPDLIPKASQAAPAEPDGDGDDAHLNLPSPGNPDRQFVLGAVKEILDKRKSEQSERHVAEERGAERVARETPSRVGFYEFTYSDETSDKLNRLSVQQLPSVTIATPRQRNRNAIFSVQSPSVALLAPECLSIEASEPEQQVCSEIEKDELKRDIQEEEKLHRPAVIDPDEVACVVSEILAGQVELALDAFCAFPSNAEGERKLTSEERAVQTDAQRTEDEEDIQCPLAIDTCTQTLGPPLRDAFTEPEEGPWMVDNASGPMEATRLVDVSVQKDADVTDLLDEPLTPPRCGTRIAPDTSLEPDAWRRRYPASPPPSRSPSPCRESPVLVASAAAAANSSSSTSADAARISSSSNNKSSETGATNSTSADIVSWLSEGEVPARVGAISPGLVASHSSTTSTDRSFMFSTLSEGQVLVPLNRFNSTPLDVSSLGEVPPFRVLTPQSESTESFQSATGSPGELVQEQFSTADDMTNQLESE